MPKHTEFKVGGVPEHFNLPWKKAIEENRFATHAIDVTWKDYGGGYWSYDQSITRRIA